MSNRRPWTLRLTAVGLLLGGLLSGCGTRDDLDNASDSNTGQIRIVNATTSFDSAQVHVDDAVKATALARGSASSYLRLTPGSHSIGLADSTGFVRNPISRAISAGSVTTLLAWENGSTISYQAIDDAETAPDAGRAKLTIVNAARDPNGVDIHLSDTTAALSIATNRGTLSSGSVSSSPFTLNAGTLRLRLTRPEATADTEVRLDTPLTLDDRDVATLVITPGSSGVLTHALLLRRDKAVTALNNTRARLRVISGLSSPAALEMRFGSTLVGTLTGSPGIGSYALVPAGTGTLQLTLGGVPISGPTWNAAAGSDATILVGGTTAAPTMTVLADDNRRAPSDSDARLRVIHALADVDQPLTLRTSGSVDLATVSPGQQSAPTTLAATSGTTVSIHRTVGGTDALYTITDQKLDARAVYTFFLLGQTSGGTNAPFHEIRAETR